MKRIALIGTSLLLILSWNLSAQEKGGDRDREKRREHIEARKIGMITEALDLSAEDAQKFWPVYNAFSDEMEAIHESRREHMEAFRDSEGDLTDAQIEEMIQHKFKTEQQILDLQKKYHKQFTQVLSMKQVGKLYVTEERFKQMLLQEMRGNRDGKGSGEPGRRGGPSGPDRGDSGQGLQQGNLDCDPSSSGCTGACKS